MNHPKQLPSAHAATIGSLPNLIVLGAQKCGTTSLHFYLGLHPQIAMSRQKELNFFMAEYNWPKGVKWYASNFSDAPIRGETSPGYTFYPVLCGVPERMYSIVPEAKLIHILRDPVERIISHYIHNLAQGKEHRPIGDALADLNDNWYVCRSKFYMQLERYLDYFPRSNILIVSQEDWRDHRQATMERVFEFLSVNPAFSSLKFSQLKYPSSWLRRKNRTGMVLARMLGDPIGRRLPDELRWKIEAVLYFPFSTRIERPILSRGLRERLIDCLSDDMARLRACTGCSFEHWCV